VATNQLGSEQLRESIISLGNLALNASMDSMVYFRIPTAREGTIRKRGPFAMDHQGQRFSRQILFPDIGAKGQEQLSASHAVIVGCGGLGTVHADLLCRAGVGKLRIIDRDFVETSNLQRQTLFSERDVLENLPKAVAAEKRLRQINSSLQIEGIVADLNHHTIENLVGQPDCILDATDNFEARFLLNDYCIQKKIPWIYGAAVSSYGMTMTILPGETPCLRCLLEFLPPAGSGPTCDTAGVVAPIVNLIASLQAAEALKILTGNRKFLNRKLIQVDIWRNNWREIDFSHMVQRETCAACGRGELGYLEGKGSSSAVVLCGRDSIQVNPASGGKLDLAAFARRLADPLSVQYNEYLLRFIAEGFEFTLFPDGRALIKGAKDSAQARSLYARYIGL
jgi:molybdopterin/thiamine biosynthesis adenylyltransferase